MIPFIEFENTNNLNCHFIHANGFPPNAYTSLLNILSDGFHVKSPLLRPHWENDIGLDNFNNWDIFLNDFINLILKIY